MNIEGFRDKVTALVKKESYAEVAQLYKAVEGSLAKEFDFDDWFQKGVCHFKLGQHQLSIESYAHALLIEPNNFQALANQAISLLEINREGEAFSLLSRVFKMNPHVGPAWLHLGHYFVSKVRSDGMCGVILNDDLKKAVAALRRAIAIMPDLGTKRMFDGSLQTYNDFIKTGEGIIPDLTIEEILTIIAT